jgi:hypothetical protein
VVAVNAVAISTINCLTINLKSHHSLFVLLQLVSAPSLPELYRAWLKITLSLIDLSYLSYLDLGFLEFDHIHICGFPTECPIAFIRRHLLYPTELQPRKT